MPPSAPQQQQHPKPPQPAPDLLDSPLDVTLPSQTNQSVPVPVPPVPPNPEKDALLTALSTSLVSQIRQTVADNSAALAPLQAQQSALRTATSRLESEISQLQQLDAALASNEQILRDAMREADRVMEDARRRKVPDVDEVLVAPHAVGNQLYGLVAEEKACADAVGVLGRALDRGAVGVDVFVKVGLSLRAEWVWMVLTVCVAMQGCGAGTVFEEDAYQEDREGYALRRVVATVIIGPGANSAWTNSRLKRHNRKLV